MTKNRFDDELLSAILDGEADAAQIARVEADPQASRRLEQLRMVTTIVREAPEPPTDARRKASIAAAMAAAVPADPAVTSLAAARHERAEQVWTPDLEKEAQPRNVRWLAVAAAVALFVLAVPVLVALRPDASSVATESADAVAEEATADVAEAASDDDAMEELTEEVMEDSADEAGTLAESAEASSAADVADTAADDAFDAEDRPFTSFGDQVRRSQLTVVATSTEIDGLVLDGTIAPIFTVDELLDAGVNPQCLEADTGLFPAQFGGVNVGTATGGLDNVVLIRFNDDGTTDLFNPQDCSVP